MAKIIFLIPRNPALSVEQFRAYYEDHHVPLALTFIAPFVVDYRRNYPVVTRSAAGAAQGSLPAPPGYDCITEMWFESDTDLHQMYAVLTSPEVSPVITADEAYFIDREKVVAIIVDERRVDASQLR